MRRSAKLEKHRSQSKHNLHGPNKFQTTLQQAASVSIKRLPQDHPKRADAVNDMKDILEESIIHVITIGEKTSKLGPRPDAFISSAFKYSLQIVLSNQKDKYVELVRYFQVRFVDTSLAEWFLTCMHLTGGTGAISPLFPNKGCWFSGS